MASSPLVSVVIASYNHAAYVRACLDSVRAQTLQDFEIIITDDGSADDTVAIIQGFDDPRIRLEVFPANRGACIAFNHGIRQARGRYIAILNSDDCFLPDKLQRQLDFLESHPGIGAVFAYPQLINETGGQFADSEHKDFSVFHTWNRDRYAWLRHFFDHGNCLCHPTVLIRRECYEHVGLLDARLAQVPDLDFWIRLTRRFEIHILPEPLLSFRIRDNQQNASAGRPEVIVRDLWERQRILRHYRDWPADEFAKVFPEYSDQLGQHSPNQLLAMHALSRGTPFHIGFGLDTWFDCLPANGEGTDYINFIRHTGQCDVHHVLQIRALQQQLMLLSQNTNAIAPSPSLPASSLRRKLANLFR
jgi:glycosyltransferase involved in cell wall biosynthesis